MSEFNLIKWFNDISIDDVPSVGGKNASLGEMFSELTPRGINIPNGFAITADAYNYFIEFNNLNEPIQKILSTLDTDNIDNLRNSGHKIRQLILNAHFPEELSEEIMTAYQKLGKESFENPDVAVRSSATAEDLPNASFAGQQETFLNIRGEASLLNACRKCFSSLFTNRALSYREKKGFADKKIALSIGVQKMVRSDLAASGVMFSIDTESGFKDAVLINSSYGLGENIVQGTVNPDEFYIFKPTLKEGFRPILRKKIGTKEITMVYDLNGSKMTKNIPVPKEARNQYSINDDELLLLAKWACIIENHYSEKRGHFSPMDIEWAKDGETDELYIVQARPETIQSQKSIDEVETYYLKERGPILVTGRSVGERIVSGQVRVINNPSELGLLQQGEILVTEKTDPDWEPVMKKASAIITNRGGRTCHAAIVSRELGLAAIVGTENGTEVLKTGETVTVSCAEGDTGFVYETELPFRVEKIQLKEIKDTKTSIKMILANPDEAFHLSFLPNDGVGLVRMEFIINHSIKIHPMALVNFKNLTDQKTKEIISKMTRNYKDKGHYFIDKLAEGVGTIAAAFYPKEVIVRMSDFKTNEYAKLLGGIDYEPKEENPMIGFRGASRYYNERYEEGFALECKAMKKVREVMGLTNLKLMIPFCRTVEEGRKVLKVMEENGLRRGEDNLEIYVMCEVPSNVILANKFLEIFDGLSIGSNDLTQLTLGVDRDFEIISPLFDERDEAVKTMISSVIKAAKEKFKKIGICGQAPSDYPDFAKFLVEEGIDSISLNPDVFLKVRKNISELEDIEATAKWKSSHWNEECQN
jgi:pyruvate,water dikinase